MSRKAIIESKNIQIIYEPFDGPRINITVSPYMIVEFNNRWSLIDMLNVVKEKKTLFHTNNRLGLINNLPFDRIVSLQIDDESKFLPSKINVNKILDSSIGTSVDWQFGLKAVEEVVVEFSERLFPYFVTKPLHKHKAIDFEKRIITYSLIPTLELENIILSYGSGLKVLKPEALRSKIKLRLKEALNVYKD